MKILERYIVKTMVFYTSVVLFIWLGIYGFFNFIEEIKSIGQADYTSIDALIYVVLDLPAVMYSHASVVILLGALLALGHLATTSQLVVIRNCGVSIMQITKMVIKAALMFMLMVILVGETLSPLSTELATNLRSIALGSSAGLHSQQGFWLKDDNFIIKAEKSLDGKTFENVMLLKYGDTNQLQTIVQADNALFEAGNFKFNRATHYTFDHQQKITNIQKQTDQIYHAPVSFNKVLLDSLKKQPHELSSIDLFKQINFLSANQISVTNYKVEFYKRIIKPITLIAMIIISMLFIFGSIRDASLGRKVFFGLVLSLVFELSSRVGGALSLRYDISPFLSASLPSFIMLFLALFLLYRKSQL